MASDMGGMFGPQFFAKFQYIRSGDRRQTIAFGPLLKTQSELIMIFLFGRKDFVEQGAFCNDCKFLRHKGLKQGSS